MKREDNIRQAVRENYTKVALKINSTTNSCTPSCCDPNENQTTSDC